MTQHAPAAVVAHPDGEAAPSSPPPPPPPSSSSPPPPSPSQAGAAPDPPRPLSPPQQHATLEIVGTGDSCSCPSSSPSLPPSALSLLLTTAKRSITLQPRARPQPSPPAFALDQQSELQPQGSWVHAGYHLTSGTTGPQVLSLPLAMAALGWGPGLFILCLGGAVSFYSYYLQIAVIEHVAKQTGQRCQRFRELSAHVLGEKWTSYLVAPLQFVVCFATVVTCIVLGGQTLKAIFQGQELSLYQFTIVFGCLHMILSQLPSLHSLRHLNFLALLASISYCGLIVYGALSTGLSTFGPKTNYNVIGTTPQRMFGVFNSLSILSNIYGNVIVVEIQATIRPPSSQNMVKGLCLCYMIILLTILPVAISGYWSFGNASNGNILMNIFPQNGGISYIPTWLCTMVNILIFIQLVVSSLMYSQPTFAVLEEPMINPDKKLCTSRNLISRLLSRSIFTVFATLFAAMLPYFGSINALIGALGYTPLVFVVPIIFYLRTFTPVFLGTKHWMNYAMVIIFSFIAVLGCLASLRQLVLDAKMYHLFANL